MLRRGARCVAGTGGGHGIDVAGLARWAEALARRVEQGEPIDAAREAPRLSEERRP
ncbi:hypothetical protein [Streptomyces bambusae]|uniref:Uncharacterized protein n=1 Tax=Streptomyces bambusae TaxID=1550616 RepID=A0ABS6Z134_9ACTN|nr:hypothetical protein [Streptomyces bambusae]MBW5481453.1 hypothetical protein [Streptomyces bambusae]